MRINITPISVESENGTVSCNEVEVSVAVSNSVAIRAVPVDGDGNEYPDAALAIVGDSSDQRIAGFMEQVATGVAALLG